MQKCHHFRRDTSYVYHSTLLSIKYVLNWLSSHLECCKALYQKKKYTNKYTQIQTQ